MPEDVQAGRLAADDRGALGLRCRSDGRDERRERAPLSQEARDRCREPRQRPGRLPPGCGACGFCARRFCARRFCTRRFGACGFCARRHCSRPGDLAHGEAPGPPAWARGIARAEAARAAAAAAAAPVVVAPVVAPPVVAAPVVAAPVVAAPVVAAPVVAAPLVAAPVVAVVAAPVVVAPAPRPAPVAAAVVVESTPARAFRVTAARGGEAHSFIVVGRDVGAAAVGALATLAARADGPWTVQSLRDVGELLG